jgi:hypothetical protein
MAVYAAFPEGRGEKNRTEVRPHEGRALGATMGEEIREENRKIRRLRFMVDFTHVASSSADNTPLSPYTIFVAVSSLLSAFMASKITRSCIFLILNIIKSPHQFK